MRNREQLLSSCFPELRSRVPRDNPALLGEANCGKKRAEDHGYGRKIDRKAEIKAHQRIWVIPIKAEASEPAAFFDAQRVDLPLLHDAELKAVIVLETEKVRFVCCKGPEKADDAMAAGFVPDPDQLISRPLKCLRALGLDEGKAYSHDPLPIVSFSRPGIAKAFDFEIPLHDQIPRLDGLVTLLRWHSR